ncbi:5'-nucleotidase, lipoprotein e(P4) family [Mucilaginibacter glaciei]|uniref:5'-nucleotidase, lipoprotein e(P4) family n=1 Tax=Mucilaginibacter glaciei TaxID=2772109 RepID=A0A926S5P8_9SPHI|nr:5'-nucleotidase, lipoprotein e(P4) family [Mucilaginibacter glaciei]MBD1392966.1 5'-nucleotidase, lipoprotein e(P4) family [Mucilaginibacter glaciei]
MKKLLPCLLICSLLTSACSTSKKAAVAVKPEGTSLANSGKVWASLWQQRSAEYRALCFQAYNLAKLRLDESLKQPGGKPLAVVTDIDETVLDNSPYDAMRAVNNLDYSQATWKAWTAKAAADTVPGAPAFFKYAAAKGVTVFYITNRDEDERANTLKNLQKFNMPNADDAHLFLRQTTSSKESRRLQVLKTHQIVLLCGDNLPDFDLLYDNHPAEANRTAITDQLRKKFGSRYIIIPNPSYGDFEGAIFNNNNKLNNLQKDSVIKLKLKVDQR